MSIRARQLLIAFLLGAFSFQSWLVYSDPTGRIDALSPEAAAGRTLWMQNGCQTCHQLHGFGGFLGPDLTNAAQHLTRARLDSVLTIGAGQMPAFGFSGSERAALSAFFDAMGATGIGQLPPLRSISAADVFAQAIEAGVGDSKPLTEVQARGRAIVEEQKCLACHLPNPVSLKRAPDLTGLIARRGPAVVGGFVTAGIPSKGMPRFDLDAVEL